jgi:hypothetical protein
VQEGRPPAETPPGGGDTRPGAKAAHGTVHSERRRQRTARSAADDSSVGGNAPVAGRGGMRTGVARCERLAPSDIDDELGDGDSGGGGFSRLQSAGRGRPTTVICPRPASLAVVI